jgi:hypothetical protein
MGADSVLVEAGYKLGMSMVPKDTTKIFNKQYEGLIAYHKATADAISSGIKTFTKAVAGAAKEKIKANKIKKENEEARKTEIFNLGMEFNQEGQEGQEIPTEKGIYDDNDNELLEAWKQRNMEFDKGTEKIATELAVGSMPGIAEAYKNGGGMSQGHQDAAYAGLKDLKEQVYAIVSKKSQTTEDKREATKLNQQAEKLKQGLVDYKGLVIATTEAYSKNLINTDLSFLGNPNEQILLKQVLDPKADLAKLGIKAFWKDGEIYYEYGPSQIFMEYASNNNIAVEYSKYATEDRVTIKGKDLLGMAVFKDIKSENEINKLINTAGELAVQKLGKTDVLEYDNFNDSHIKDPMTSSFKSILMAPEANITDLLSRDILIGNTNRNYKKDLLQNPAINTLTYSSLGLTGSVDKNKDGVISSDELSSGDKETIIGHLTNPQTMVAKKAAIDEFSKYCLGLAKQEFDYMRKKINASKGGRADKL